MKRMIFVFTLLIISLLVGCNTDSNTTNEDNYYSVYTFSNYDGSNGQVINTPKICYTSFSDISKDITNASDYFSNSTFENYIVLCIERNSEPASNYIEVSYSDFNISEETLNITCYYVGDVGGDRLLCTQIDFIVIPKTELKDKDINNLGNDKNHFLWNINKIEMFGFQSAMESLSVENISNILGHRDMLSNNVHIIEDKNTIQYLLDYFKSLIYVSIVNIEEVNFVDMMSFQCNYDSDIILIFYVSTDDIIYFKTNNNIYQTRVVEGAYDKLKEYVPKGY